MIGLKRSGWRLVFCIPLLLLGFRSESAAQEGDEGAQAQPLLIPREQIPPSPVLSPADALKSFHLPPGFRVEIVASEPLVKAPIALAFDPEGQLWVLEMPGYMQDVTGSTETHPTGSIAVLHDADGDGRMDRREVFLDGLVMPRAFAFARDGVLVAAPPSLAFWRDTNGDGRADEKTLLSTNYAVQADPRLGSKANPEHASNGLMRALDNWYYSANHSTRLRFRKGEWEESATAFRGQWGLSQDDYGRLVYNSNSDPLRIDPFPAELMGRHPGLRNPAGVNVDPVKDRRTWPARVTPGINRGYQPEMLRDGRLAVFTAACGPVIYRGNQFPREFRGNAFVCEPAGNLIKRSILTDKEGEIEGKHAYPDREFLTSTDERFRPVNLFNGPDGALYVADMYRGILQHRIYLTTYLRTQIRDRGLDQPTDLGRIYRITHEGVKPSPPPRLGQASATHWVRMLSHPNGWWRDTAQRLLVEKADATAVAALKRLVVIDSPPLAQIHALWTLEGLGVLDRPTHADALGSTNAKVRATAVRLSLPFLEGPTASDAFSQLQSLLKHRDLETRVQLALIFSQIRAPSAKKALIQMARDGVANPILRDALASGLLGRETEFLAAIAPGMAFPGCEALTESLARCAFESREPVRVERLLNLALDDIHPRLRSQAVLDGILASRPKSANGQQPAAAAIKPPIEFPAEPAVLAALRRATNSEVMLKLAEIESMLSWPGKKGASAKPAVVPLTEAQKVLFEQGQDLYSISCGACHQPHGNGQEGLAPPLADSEWVLGSESRLIRMALHGVRGVITVKGKQYQLEMPAFGIFEDEQLASILTYIRREWGNTGTPVGADQVGKVRKQTEGRIDAWTESELQAIAE